MRRLLLGAAAAAIALTATEGIREHYSVHNSDLRAFNGKAVGQLDAIMWRSYYERRPVALFRQLIETMRTQFHLPPMRAIACAYRAGHAAFVFKDGRSRTDYEKALPDLERYFASVSLQATEPFDASKAARLELEWWILHRERSPELAHALAAVQAEVYHLQAASFAEHAQLRGEAMVLRDDKGSAINEADWRKIGEMLERSWMSLAVAVQRTSVVSAR